MHSFIVVNASGHVVRTGSLILESDIALQPLAEGERIIPDQTGRVGVDMWDGEAVVLIPTPEPTVAEQKATLLARLAERRWEVETGGITIGGMKVETDDRSKLLIVNAAARAREDSTYTVRWKIGPGTFVVLNAETLIDAETAVFTHVQKCFSREAELSDLIDAAEDPASLADVVEAFWL